MTGRSDNQWPGPRDKPVIDEMLENLNSEHWSKCREFMTWLVRREISKSSDNLPADLLEDIVQNAMISVFTNLPHFRYESRLTTWLTPIAYTRTIDALRNRARKGPMGPLPDNPQKGEENEAGAVKIHEMPRTVEDECITRAVLREVLAEIPRYLSIHANSERNSKIVQMVLIEGKSIEDTAKQLGVPAPVAGYVVRSLQRHLREKFKPGPPST